MVTRANALRAATLCSALVLVALFASRLTSSSRTAIRNNQRADIIRELPEGEVPNVSPDVPAFIPLFVQLDETTGAAAADTTGAAAAETTGAAAANGTAAADGEDEEVDTKDYSIPCGGPCDNEDYTCVIKKDESYSQCVDCGLNYKYTCQFFDNDLRWASEKYCLRPCMKRRPTPSCGQGPMFPNYARDQCFMQKDGTMLVNCAEQDPSNCGVGASSHKKSGKGIYSISLQAAAGDGIATSFYLYTFGQNESKEEDWNSITMTVFGSLCSANKSKVLTQYAAGEFVANAKPEFRKLEHQKFVEVPFDACADWHTYTIDVNDTLISWMVDETTVREQDMTHYSDMVKSIKKGTLEARFSLWAQNATTAQSAEMGMIEDNGGEFPVGAWFANIYLPTM